MLRFTVFALACLFHCLLFAQAPMMVKDICLGNSGSGLNNISSITDVSGVAYFWANDCVHGYELWRSDGTEAGTYLVKDIYPGSSGSGASSYAITNVSGVAYFFASDGIHGYELWRSNGTEAGTYLVKDIYPGSSGSALGGYSTTFDVSGLAYFWASDGIHGYELWRSNGTEAGTYLVKDIYPGSNNSVFGNNSITNINGVAYFWANDGVHGIEVWRSDGTEARTHLIKDIYPSGTGSGYSNINSYTVSNINGVAYFWANDGMRGIEVWRSDGTNAGTYILKSINPYSGSQDNRGVESGYPINNINGLAYFWANDFTHGLELWRSDGTSNGTYLVKDILPGRSGGGVGADFTVWSNEHTINAVGGTVYFWANDGAHGYELWRSDGTNVGTYLVKDIYPGRGDGSGSYSGGPYPITNVSGLAYFWANDGVHGVKLWRSDGTEAGTYLVKDISPSRGTYVGSITTNVNGVNYFWANDGIHGTELWKLEGTTTQHFHQVPQSTLFQTRQLLAEGKDFKVCADGSEASVFKVYGGGQDYSQAVIKIPGANVTQTGSFSVIQPLNKDSLVVHYKHPDYIQTLGSSVTLVAGVYATPSSTTPITTFDITVYRAPVLMVHGLWSDSSAFRAMETSLRNSQLYPSAPSLVRRGNYKSTNTWTFVLNVPKIKTEVEALIQSLRDANVAAGNVDYVGHSMGGILGRMYLQGDTYECGFHKLITLNTPHSGSQLANLIRSKPTLICDLIVPYGFDVQDACGGGALDNLQVDSPVIRNTLNGSRLNYRTVPAHTVATVEYQTPQEIINGLFSAGLKAQPKNQIKDVAFYTFLDVLPSTLFNMGTSAFYDGLNDWIVSVISQQGGMMGNCTTLIENQRHTGSPVNNQVVDRVKALLLSEPSSVSFCQYFNPARISYGGGGRLATVNTTNAGSIRIVSPVRGQSVASGSSMNINVTGTDLTEIKTFVDYNTDSIYIARTSGTQATFTLTADSRFLGKKSIVVLGKTSSGEYVADTTHFYVSNTVTSGTCNSLQSGDWTNSAIWSCGHEPTMADIVTVNSGHVITVSSSTAQASRIIYKGGVIKLSTTSAKVFLKGGD